MKTPFVRCVECRDFTHLQQQLLARLLPSSLQAGESLSAAIERVQRISKLEKTIQQLEAQLLNKSMQFNRRVELNQQLKSAQQKKKTLLKE